MIDCVVENQSITMRRAAQERKPQPDPAKGRPTATGAQKIFKLASDCTANTTLEAVFQFCKVRHRETIPHAED